MSIIPNLTTYLTEICEVIKSRPTGSSNNQKAVEYIEKILTQNGLTVTRQQLSCMDWQNNGAFLSILGEACPIEASNYSAPCDLTAPYLCVGTLEQLRMCSAKGKILVIYDELCQEPLAPKNYPWYNPENHQEIIKAIEAQEPLALITVSFHPTRPISIIEDGDFHIPCGVVSGEQLPFLLNHTNSTLSLRLNTKRIPATAHNLIAHYGPSTSKKIAFSAHLDTKPTTAGALDDGTGIATLLALSAVIPTLNCPYQIELVFFNGEDYYDSTGEATYVNTYLSSPNDYLFAVNIDGVGLKDSKNSYSFYSCQESFIASVKQMASSFSTIEEIEPWPEGDHSLYEMSQVAAIALTSSQIFSILDDIIHTEKDTLDLIDFTALEDVTHFCLNLLSL